MAKCACRMSCKFYEIGKRCPEGSTYTPRESVEGERVILPGGGLVGGFQQVDAVAPKVEQAETSILLMMVGLPRCGKSTAALQLKHPIVSCDSIRKALGCYPFNAEREPEVWATARVMVLALFASGHRVVTLDATNITRKLRDEWIDPRWVRRFALFDVNEEAVAVCKQRGIETGQDYILPVIDRMFADYEPFTDAELAEWER